MIIYHVITHGIWPKIGFKTMIRLYLGHGKNVLSQMIFERRLIIYSSSSNFTGTDDDDLFMSAYVKHNHIFNIEIESVCWDVYILCSEMRFICMCSQQST